MGAEQLQAVELAHQLRSATEQEEQERVEMGQEAAQVTGFPPLAVVVLSDKVINLLFLLFIVSSGC